MGKYTRTRFEARFRGRTICAASAALALLVMPLALTAGCDDAVADEFRSAAMGPIESGLKSIMDGLISGIFTLATPNTSTVSGGETTTTGDGGASVAPATNSTG